MRWHDMSSSSDDDAVLTGRCGTSDRAGKGNVRRIVAECSAPVAVREATSARTGPTESVVVHTDEEADTEGDLLKVRMGVVSERHA